MNVINIILICFVGLLNARTVIEQIDDSDLVHLLTNEDNVIVLFSKSNCSECDEIENVLENIYDDLKSDIGAVVVKAHNSHMVNLYDPTKEPALIYFRRGMPLLYYGKTDGEEILQVFSENREPIVKELSDENFEHLTQAATGATTGDWFVFFYSADCIFCLRLYATWEAVGARLKHRLNVARINRLGAGITTSKRFSVSDSPEFLFLRQGKVFRYKSKEYTAGKLIEFAQSGYTKQKNPEIVPPEGTSLNSVLSDVYSLITINSQIVYILSAVVLLIIIIGYIRYASLKGLRAEKRNDAKKAK